VECGIHSKIIQIRSKPSHIYTSCNSKLGSVNEASQYSFLLAECLTFLRRRRMVAVVLHKNKQATLEVYSLPRNLLFMRCIKHSYNVEITSEAMILSLYMFSILSI